MFKYIFLSNTKKNISRTLNVNFFFFVLQCPNNEQTARFELKHASHSRVS
jgi:hypothetical protein